MMKRTTQKVMKAWISRLTVIFALILLAKPASALSVKDSTAFSMPVFVIDWIDNDGKPRKVCMVKDTYSSKTGVCVFIRYYDGSTPVNIQSYDPEASSPWNSGFGSTVHHSGTYHSGGTLTKRFQGDHLVIFDWVQNLDGAVETVTYTFMDGLDYFQWQETVDATNGTLAADARGPYCTMQWNGDFTAVDGQEYSAAKYFTQNSYNNSWTLSGDATSDIPFVRQWDTDKEVGYVQTQTYNQQLAGSPFSLGLPASGTTVTATDANSMDFQMNFYDQAKKITWGMPYGYMNNGGGTGMANGASTGNKNGWGQYSLSIVFDTKIEDGVRRVRNENRAIHDGTVSLTAIKGSIVTIGPVGTANSATQTLSPAGYDHNYRTWWMQPDGAGETEVTFNAGTATLKNPTFRIQNMSDVPGLIKYDNVPLVEGTDYYASYNSSSQEAWVTIKRDFTGSKSVYFFDGNPTGIVISAASVTPSSVYNNVSSNLAFSVTATDDGSISSITLDLTSIGGGAAVPLTLGGSNTWTHNYNLAAGASVGTKTIVATVTDNSSNTKTKNITLTVNPSYEYLNIYTDAETMVTGTWAQPTANGATLTEQNGLGAIEGVKDYSYTGTATAWFAGFGLNLTNWSDANAKDFSAYDYIEFSYKGPSAGTATSINISFGGIGGNSAPASAPKNYPLSAAYTTIQVPLTDLWVADGNGAATTTPFDLTKVTTITFSLGSGETVSGTFTVDNIRLVRPVSASPEMDVKPGGTSVASGGTYDFGSVVSGNSGTAVTFTIENIGSADLTLSGTPKVAISGTDQSSFSIVQTALSSPVAASGTTSFTITFSPSTVGTKSAQISIANDDADENPYVINLTGTATAAPAPEINVKIGSTSKSTGSTHDFGSILEGTSGTAVTFTIENTGSADLNLTASPIVVKSGTDQADFTIVQTSANSPVAASGTTTFTIAFSPSSPGSKTAQITIANNDSDEGSYVINLSGTGTAATPEINVKASSTDITSGGSHNFGSIAAGSTGSAITFTIENIGTASLNLTASPMVAISGTDQSDFIIVQTSTSSPVAAPGTTTFTVTFSPASAGSKSAQITIANNDSDEGTYVISLSGTATTATGVKGSLNTERISAYPNPFAAEFILSLDGISGESKVIVRNELGKVVKELSGNGSAGIRIEMDDQPSGMYFIEISTSEGMGVKKIFKN